MRCSAYCPRHAIEAGQSWGVLLYFISTVPVAAYLFSWLNGYVSGVANLGESWIGSILDLLYYYPAIFLSYYLFHILLRIPAMHWIFTHTTMTHLSFWGRYHEPGTKLKQIAFRNTKNGNWTVTKIKH